MYMMLDPSRTGEPDTDRVVFAREHSRLGYGETRTTAAELEPSWRPWSRADDATAALPKTVEALVPGQWRKASSLDLVEISFEGVGIMDGDIAKWVPTRGGCMQAGDSNSATAGRLLCFPCS